MLGPANPETRHRRKVADITVDDAEQRDDRGLAGGDAIKVAHGSSLPDSRYVSPDKRPISP